MGRRTAFARLLSGWLRRSAVFAVCACLLLSAAAVPACAEMEDRFGSDAQVITDGNGHPTLVNGYPVREATAAYYDKGQQQVYNFSVDFTDYPFWRSSTTYDGNLAAMSLGMALSASRPVLSADAEKPDPSGNLAVFLSSAGFSQIRTDDYSRETSMYTVSTGIGSRVMEAEGQEPFTLIAVGICGSNYRNEWQSNMTPGNGDRHEGFENAPRLVLDRLAGYIATRGIKGRIKIWLSGFSRAAAVANLTAAEIAGIGMADQEDIYAYTFATPAAVRNPPASGYEHIHNIICPMDLIPQVMPADWGYGRYGTDYFLAVPEFSSYMGGAVARLRALEDETRYAVVNYYSPELNFRLRLLFSLLLDEVNSLEYFNQTFQPALVGLMRNKTIPNALSTLRNLMITLQRSDRDQRANTDELMDYFFRLYGNTLSRSGLGANDSNSATALYRLLNEHNENSYLANLDAIRLAAFEPSTEMCYVMVRGPVTVSLSYEEEPGRPATAVCMGADGKRIEQENDLDSEIYRDSFYIERCENTTVLAVPRDLDYTVTWTAEQNGTVECLTACLSVHASAVYTGYRSEPARVQAGDSGTAFRQENGRIVSEGLTEETIGGRELAEFAQIASLGINWRLALTIGCTLAGLVVTAILCAVLSRKPSRRKQYAFLTWLLLCLFGIGVLESEVAFWFFADRPLIRLGWKALSALCLLLLFFRVHPPERPYRNSMLPGLALALTADMVFSFQAIAGMALFLLAHVLLILFFLRGGRMSRRSWIRWAVVVVPLTAVIVLHFAPLLGIRGWAAAVYTPVLFLMGFSSEHQPIRIRAGALCFVLSDLLLGIYAALWNDPMIHMIYMGFFNLALVMLVVGKKGRKNTLHKTDGTNLCGRERIPDGETKIIPGSC